MDPAALPSRPPTLSPTTVSAVVVDHDAGDLLARCLATLIPQVGEVVVVENGDATSAQAVLAAAGLEVPVLDPGINLGYGAGANRGVAALARSEAVVVTNADVTFRPGAVAAMARSLVARRDAAVVGPTIVNEGGDRYPSWRRFPSLTDAAGHALLGLVVPDNRFSVRYREGLRPAPEGSSPEADWVSGACLLVRREAFEELGGFDESFFMYAEDTDLCWRARRHGWAVLVEPSAEVTHVQGVSTGRHPYAMALEHHRSAWRFARRSTSGWRKVALPGAAAVLGLRLVVDLATCHRRRRP